MTHTLQQLNYSKEIVFQGNKLTHVYRLNGALCSTDALWLKNSLNEYTPGEHILVDMSRLTKADLIAVNALVVAHKRHHLTLVMPYDEKAREIFHLTQLHTSFNIIASVKSYEAASSVR